MTDPGGFADVDKQIAKAERVAGDDLRVAGQIATQGRRGLETVNSRFTSAMNAVDVSIRRRRELAERLEHEIYQPPTLAVPTGDDGSQVKASKFWNFVHPIIAWFKQFMS